MANKIKIDAKDFKQQIKKVIKEEFDDVCDKSITPKLKELMAKHADDVNLSEQWHARFGGTYVDRPHRRLNKTENIVATKFKNGHVTVKNVTPPANSVYHTEIRSPRDTILTEWIVNGSIPMLPPDSLKEEWNRSENPAEECRQYFADESNRYDPCPYIDNIYDDLNKPEIKKELGNALSDELVRRLIKKMK